MRYVALLRGINVGGKNTLPMAALAQIFRDAGCTDVATYIQSGNVVFEATARIAKTIAATATAAVAATRGFAPVVVVRSRAQWQATIEGKPFAVTGADAKRLHVMFLADRPSAAAIALLDPNRSPGDAFVVLGTEIYLHLPNGVADSKLTNAYIDAKLQTTSTMRNWTTVLRLMELLDFRAR